MKQETKFRFWKRPIPGRNKLSVTQLFNPWIFWIYKHKVVFTINFSENAKNIIESCYKMLNEFHQKLL